MNGTTQEPQREKSLRNVLTPLGISVSNLHKFYSAAMEFKEKAKLACRVKNLIVLCLITLFFWWGSNAVVRYWSQPLSTDIKVH